MSIDTVCMTDDLNDSEGVRGIAIDLVDKLFVPTQDLTQATYHSLFISQLQTSDSVSPDHGLFPTLLLELILT